MFELSHLAAAYVVGSAAAVWLFRLWVKEKIITATIDTLARDGYLHSVTDRDGVVHLTKWYDIAEEEFAAWEDPNNLDVLDQLSAEEITEILEKLIEQERKEHEEDDTP